MSSQARFIVAVAGGSGSGKTTFAKLLAAALNGRVSETNAPLGPEHADTLKPEHWNGEVAALLSQDCYYIDQSGRFVRDGGDEVNFDHPDALDLSLLARHLGELRSGRSVEVPIYDFATHTRRPETLRQRPTPVVIVDGILILTRPEVVRHFDEVIFLDIDEEIRFERRFRRDVQERGRSAEGVREQFLRQVKPMHDLFVQPSASRARKIISCQRTFQSCLSEVYRELTGRLGAR